ncbi:MAG TPA: thioredoxin domain-containing protein [Patescibacteria group bacterium]|nr:thioredoxin domain-containing protein [Patescibacteria group bacterium]
MEDVSEGKNSTESEFVLTKKERRELAKEGKRKAQLKNENTNKLKKYLIGLLVIAGLVFIGYKAWIWIKTPGAGNTEGNQNDSFSVRDSDWVKGNKDAKLTLIEYGDFECPACTIYSELVNRVIGDYPNDLRVVFRHFPLPTHKNSIPGAKAAEAAGVQGKFWKMHDLLYLKQSDWTDEGNPKDKFVEYAKSLGLDEERFKTDFDSKEIKDRINSDASEALRLRINSTPTFFLNGKILPQINGYEDFKKIIENALKA